MKALLRIAALERPLVLAFGLIAAATAAARAEDEIEIRPCPETIGIEALFPPYDKHARTFYDGQLSIFNTDTVEPAARSKGIVLTFPENESSGTGCIYVGPFASVSDVSDAKTSYDADKGLLIVLKTGEYGPDGPTDPTEPLRLRFNMKAGSVSAE